METRALFDLSGRVAVVTGGGRGLGKVMAEALLEAGAASVVITGRRAEWLNETVAEFRARGFDCHAYVADVTKPEDVERVVGEVLAAFNHIDILVNNAGQTWGQATSDMPLVRWQQVIDTNLTGMFLMAQTIGRHMLAGNGGTIINVSSVAGIAAGDHQAVATIAYNTSKAGVISFTRTLAMEWGRRGIRVNGIAPGWFPTRMAAASIAANRERFEDRTALGRVGDPEELKGVTVFLASAASSYLTGQTIVVDGGISL